MNVLINDKEETPENGTTVPAMLDARGLTGRHVALEPNGEILPTSACADHSLQAGDQVESDDAIVARQLEEPGCIAVMPLAAPVGSGPGICNAHNILTIVEHANVPILVDAGVGTAAAVAMEPGYDGVLMNTATAGAGNQVLMNTATTGASNPLLMNTATTGASNPLLMNTAIVGAGNPVLMASAMEKATAAGRDAFLAGRIPRQRFASASSPLDGTTI